MLTSVEIRTRGCFTSECGDGLTGSESGAVVSDKVLICCMLLCQSIPAWASAQVVLMLTPQPQSYFNRELVDKEMQLLVHEYTCMQIV